MKYILFFFKNIKHIRLETFVTIQKTKKCEFVTNMKHVSKSCLMQKVSKQTSQQTDWAYSDRAMLIYLSDLCARTSIFGGLYAKI